MDIVVPDVREDNVDCTLIPLVIHQKDQEQMYHSIVLLVYYASTTVHNRYRARRVVADGENVIKEKKKG